MLPVKSKLDESQYHCRPNTSNHVDVTVDKDILDKRAQKLIHNTRINTCRVPTSSKRVEETAVETSCKNGGSWLDMTPKYNASKIKLIVSRSSI